MFGKKGKVRVSCMLILLLFSMTIPMQNTNAWEENNEKTVVRVGCLDYENFTELQEDGSVTGYCVDYLNELAKYDNFSFEYVFGDWNSLRQMLNNHEVDLIYTRKNDDLAFDYSQERLVLTLTALYARQDDDDFYYDDLQRLDGATVGFVNSNFNKKYFSEYAATKGFKFQACFYDTQEHLKEALLNRQLDVIASDSMLDSSGLKCVGSYGTEVMYLATWQGNLLMKRIDYAMNEVTSLEYDFSTKLFEQYFSKSRGLYNTNYTRKEAEFIKNCPTLKIAFSTNASPMSYIDQTTGEVIGITPSMLQLISQKSGIQFSFFPVTGQSQSYEYDYFRDNQVDLIAGIEVNKYNEHIPGLVLTDSYFSATKVLVGRKGENITGESDCNIAIVGGSVTLPYVIADAFPNFHIKTYDSIEQCLAAVSSGEANVLLYNQYLIEQQLTRPQYDNLTILPSVEVVENSAISPVDYANQTYKNKEILDSPILITVLNKAIASITDQEINNIIIKHTVERDASLSFEDSIYKFRYPLIGIALLMMVVMGLLIRISIVKERNLAVMSHKNSQLADAIRQANTANTTKSQFLAQMSHEIRTPLNAIVGMTSLAEKVEDNPERTQEYLGKIDISSKLLLSIINDVLDMSAIENKKLKIAHAPFDLKQLLLSISTVYYSQCEQKGVDFKLVMPDVIEEMLVGDSLRVNQILMNLVSNAYKFTEAGGSITITIAQQGKQEHKIFMRFVVSDTGCGMSEDLKNRLFQAFEQENAQTAKKHGGSGLGLAITKNLVEMMHGAIDVQSELGRGTTFTVDLPFEITDEVYPADHRILNSLKVLVADDDDYACQYMGNVLAQMNVGYEIAHDGKEAVEMIEHKMEKNDSYDVCFLDWKMPELSGLEVTRKIRKIADKDTLVIIVSAYDLSEISEEAKEAGADLFITKPFFQSSIFNALITAKSHQNHNIEEEEETYDFTGKKVLMAEDFELNREVAVDLLAEVNLAVDCAENGKEAVDMFEQSKVGTYDLILMDIQMPEMDGLEAARNIRASSHPQAKNIPIFAMTANAFTDDIAAALSAGMNGHIAKPIDVDALYKLLNKNLHL